MKKIISLALAAGLLVGATTQANAADFELSGGFTATAGVSNNAALADADTVTNLKGYTELEIALDIAVTDNVKGVFSFTLPDGVQWGSGEYNPALGEAYFSIPLAMLQANIGYQDFAAPGYLGSGVNPAFDESGAGIVLSADFGVIAPQFAWLVTGLTEDDEKTATQNVYALSLPINLGDITVTPWATMLDNRGADSETYMGAVVDAEISNIAAGAGVIYAMDAAETANTGLLVEGHFAIDLGMLTPGIAVWYGMEGADGGLASSDLGSWGAFNGANDGLFGNGIGLHDINETEYDPFNSLGLMVNVANVALGDVASLGAHVAYIMTTTDVELDPNMEIGANLVAEITENVEFALEANYFMPMAEGKGNAANVGFTVGVSF